MITGAQYKFKSKVWRYPGMAGWYFISLPQKESKQIKSTFSDLKRGWGSLRVKVTIGSITWKTSIFPDSKSGTYLLPIKAEVRKKENLTENTTVRCLIEILV
ncbi:MAG TPA: DUF1905 domain-containing protein [Patescibacteria group bacterium]|nr:DUF1905 domain-containing protein [Patescibacteria group bacterium]